jgi:hypothetical protein
VQELHERNTHSELSEVETAAGIATAGSTGGAQTSGDPARLEAAPATETTTADNMRMPLQRYNQSIANLLTSPGEVEMLMSADPVRDL